MREITTENTGEMAEWLEKTFRVEHAYCGTYARIACFLSNEAKMKDAIINLSLSLESAYWAIVKREGNGVANKMTRAIAAVGRDYGFSGDAGAVFSGYVVPYSFRQHVWQKRFWKDAVSSNHGEHSHSFQWLMIAQNLDIDASEYYKFCCEYRSTKVYLRPTSKDNPNDQIERLYLWDLLVDCFDYQLTPDWKENIVSHTARSPTHLNKMIHVSDCWLKDQLRARYMKDKRNWNMPGEGFSEIADYARKEQDKKVAKGLMTLRSKEIYHRSPANPMPAYAPLQGVLKRSTRRGKSRGWNSPWLVEYHGGADTGVIRFPLSKDCVNETPDLLPDRPVTFELMSDGLVKQQVRKILK